MTIELDYLKQLLEKMLKIEKPYFHVNELTNDLLDHKFIFHLQILADQYYVVKDHDGSNDIGLNKFGRGQYAWGIVDLRLHAEGHRFAEALMNDTVWKKLKSGLSKEFKTLSLETIKSAAGFLVQQSIENSLK